MTERSYFDRPAPFDPELQSDEDLERALVERRNAEHRLRALQDFNVNFPSGKDILE